MSAAWKAIYRSGRLEYFGPAVHACLMIWCAFISNLHNEMFYLGLQLSESVSISAERILERSQFATSGLVVTLPVVMFGIAVGILISISAAVLNASKKHYPRAILSVCVPILIWVVCFPLLRTPTPDTDSAMLSAINRVAERGAPIVEAIENYESDLGKYPADLDDLVPDYIDQIPSPGIAVCDEYHYERVGMESEYILPKTYILVVPLAHRVIPLDVFYYAPDEDRDIGLKGNETDWRWWTVH